MYCMLICRKLFEILSHPYWMTMQPRKQNIIWSKFSPFLKVFFQLEQTTEAFFLRWKSIYIFQATIFCHRLSTVYIDKKKVFSAFFCLPLLSFFTLSFIPSLSLTIFFLKILLSFFFPFSYILYSIFPLSLFFYMPFNSTSLLPLPHHNLSKLYFIYLSSLILFSVFFFCLFFLFFLLFMYLLWRTTYVVG